MKNNNFSIFMLSLSLLLLLQQQHATAEVLDSDGYFNNVTTPYPLPNCSVCCSTLVNRSSQTFLYFQDTGRFVGGLANYTIDTVGYSGNGTAQNDPTKQCTAGIGPAPTTQYNVTACQDTLPGVNPAPCTFILTPGSLNDVCGREDFWGIQGCDWCDTGDQAKPPISGCSNGSIVLNIYDRMQLRVGDIVYVISFEPRQQ